MPFRATSVPRILAAILAFGSRWGPFRKAHLAGNCFRVLIAVNHDRLHGVGRRLRSLAPRSNLWPFMPIKMYQIEKGKFYLIRSAPYLLKLDHLTVVAPTLSEGVSHVRDCLGIEVPFGSRHEYMGTHNHRIQLGNSIYLEIVALDPEGCDPGRPRWFGLSNQEQVRTNWDAGRRLRGWVANTESIDFVLSRHSAIFGEKVALPVTNPSFAFAIPKDGALPLDGVAPSIIDHWGDAAYIAAIPDLGARLSSFTVEHPDPIHTTELYDALGLAQPPKVVRADNFRLRALIRTQAGLRELT